MDVQHGLRMARPLIETTILQLEQCEKSTLNLYYVADVAAAASLVCDSVWLLRANRMLKHVPKDPIYAKTKYHRDLRKGFTRAKAEERYPMYDLDAMLRRSVCLASEPHLKLCSEKRFDEAFEQAQSELEREEVVATASIFGEFETVLRLIRGPAMPVHRLPSLMLIITIEAFRYNHQSFFQELFSVQEQRADQAWLAMGLCNRRPWDSYPYADW